MRAEDYCELCLLASDHSRRLQILRPHISHFFYVELSEKPNSIVSLKEPPSEWHRTRARSPFMGSIHS